MLNEMEKENVKVDILKVNTICTKDVLFDKIYILTKIYTLKNRKIINVYIIGKVTFLQ